MGNIRIVVNLPEELAEQARKEGLLTDENFAEFLKAELQRKREQAADKLFEKLEKLRAVQPPLTPEEIEAELEAYRVTRAAKLLSPK